MKKIFSTFGFMLLVICLIIEPVCAIENIWVDDDIIPTPMFRKALFYWSSHNYQSALDAFQNIVDQYPGTAYAANAQLCKIDLYQYCPTLKNPQKALHEYRLMLQNYPNTKYWLIAKSEILYTQYPTFATWLPAENQLLMDFGGENIYDIIEGKSQNYDASQIAPQYRLVLAESYTAIAINYEYNKNFENAIKFYAFVADNFPKYTRIEVKDNLISCVLKSKNINDYSQYPKDTTPPQITIDSPHHGNRVHGLKPRIQVALQDGDIMAAQVNLSKLIFTLDGEDVTDKMKVHSAINTSAQPGGTFEKIKIVYKPESPLAVGSHTVYVKAEDYGGRAGEKTWTFTLAKPETNRPDEEK